MIMYKRVGIKSCVFIHPQPIIGYLIYEAPY
jgi:hypothetical protein